MDWTSDESAVLLNPRMPDAERARLENVVPPWKRTVFVATSGTTGALKLVALSKEAILASAAAVNHRLNATREDVWCRVLPLFHVGGLGIIARAFLTQSKVMEIEWSVDAFAESGATLASLVPAQVHDLVRAGRKAPAGIRGILVGGGAFDTELQAHARKLGWPMLATYGMSECASTITVENVLLPHLEAREEEDGRVALRGDSLLTAYVFANGAVVDPKQQGWFVSEDYGEVRGRMVRIAGRASDFIKIGGESVDLKRLDAILDSVRGGVEAAIVAVDDPRLGSVIHMVSTSEAAAVAAAFNDRVLPFERVRKTHLIQTIPRSSLGKLLRGRIQAQIDENLE